MTNAEKYLKDEKALFELPVKLRNFLNEKKYGCVTATLIMDFFKAKVKPEITEDERVILRNIKWKENMPTTIGRDEKSGLYISFGKDLQSGYWSNLFFGHLFQFIKERRRI